MRLQGAIGLTQKQLHDVLFVCSQLLIEILAFVLEVRVDIGALSLGLCLGINVRVEVLGWHRECVTEYLVCLCLDGGCLLHADGPLLAPRSLHELLGFLLRDDLASRVD